MNSPVSALRIPALAVLASLLLGCAGKPLLENLEERQANEVVAMLLHNNIGAEKRREGKSGYRVDVAGQDLAEAIELTHRLGVPSPARTQVAGAFPADALVSTPLGERARLISAVEQRLEESLMLLDGVQSSRVHLNYDANLGGEGRLPDGRSMHVAAVLQHAAGVDEDALLQSAKRFLRNTFHDIDYDNVSVILAAAPTVQALAVTETGGGSSNPAWAWVPVALGIALAGCLWLLRGVPAVRRQFARAREWLGKGLKRAGGRGDR